MRASASCGPGAVDRDTMSRAEHMPVASTEPVLLVPPATVTSVFALLAEARFVASFWHIGGRFGSRIRGGFEATGGGSPLRAIPLTESAAARLVRDRASLPPPLRRLHDDLAAGQGIELRWVAPEPSKRLPKPEPRGDGTVHPELRERDGLMTTNVSLPALVGRHEGKTTRRTPGTPAAFTFAELFAGIGGFRQGLEALGGECVFANEMQPECCAAYRRNYSEEREAGPGESSSGLCEGDIRLVADADIPPHDILVGGFPCQPFTAAGLQPGLGAAGGGGSLFLEIVRILRACRPRAFLLENVPGLLSCDGGRAFATILESLEGAGYQVHSETVNARCLTAQSRNRLYIIGFRADDDAEGSTSSVEAGRTFSFPFIPDLGLRAADILQSDEELAGGGLPSAESYTLTDTQFERLRQSHSWKTGGPNKLAWGNKVCRTLISNYGANVGNGNSQLVPRSPPHHPRRFTPRECARLMGFPDAAIELGRPGMKECRQHEEEEEGGRGEGEEVEGQQDTQCGDASRSTAAWFRNWYRILGNAVCPPVIAALGGAILDHCPDIAGERSGILADASGLATEGHSAPVDSRGGGEGEGAVGWREAGRIAAVRLALGAVVPVR